MHRIRVGGIVVAAAMGVVGPLATNPTSHGRGLTQSPAAREVVRVVVATFDEQGVPAGMGDVVADLLTRSIDAPNVELLERRQVRRVLEEQAFGESDLTQSADAVRFGRLADSRFVLVGTVYRIDGTYIVSARIVDSETGIVRESARAVVQFRSVDEMAARTNELARALGLRVASAGSGESGESGIDPSRRIGEEPMQLPLPSPSATEPEPAPAPAPAPALSTVRDVLEKVEDPDEPPVAVSIGSGASARLVHEGDLIPIRLSSPRSGYLSLFVVDAQGTVRMLLPHPSLREIKISADKPLTIPGHVPIRLRAAPPFGPTRIKVLVTEAPITVDAKEDAAGALREVELAQGIGSAAGSGWSIGELEFIVVPEEADGTGGEITPAPPPSPAPGVAPEDSVRAPQPPADLPAAEPPPSAASPEDAIREAYEGSIRVAGNPDAAACALLRWPLLNTQVPGVDLQWSAVTSASRALPLVGVIDADFDPDDPALQGAFSGLDEGVRAELRQEIRRNGLAPMRHGNRVASLIAGSYPCIPAVLPGAAVVPIRVTSSITGPAYRTAPGDAAELLAALRQALDAGCKVVNLSLSVPLDGDELTRFTKDTVWRDLESAGVVLVCAAGNEGIDLDANPRYPACLDQPNILCVGAIGPDGALAHWAGGGASSYGSGSVDILVPGTALLVSDGGARLVLADGTSYACALASGLVARTMALHPGDSAASTVERVTRSARPITGMGTACRGGLATWPKP